MNNANVKTLVFSSSATVYGASAPVPYKETMPIGTTTNPYGTSKAMIERILADQCIADPQSSVASLSYFNPIGADRSGLIGEDPQGIPSNLLPYISQVAVGKLKALLVLGGNFPTPDGTGVRNYIHIVDLEKGHLKALAKIQNKDSPHRVCAHIWNLGTGTGSPVLQVIKAFELASNKKIPYSIASRRQVDIARC
jgi:UDP-glucose 4-epimerase